MNALQQRTTRRVATAPPTARHVESAGISTIAVVLTVISVAGLLLSSLSRTTSPRRRRRSTRHIVGASQRSILARFGQPKATAGSSTDRVQTWYYPLDSRRQLTLAVEFVGGIVRAENVLRT